MKLQKYGGFALLASICVYIVFLAYAKPIFLSVKMKDMAEVMAVMSSTASGKLYVLLLLWLVYLLLGFFVIVALHERMHADAPYLSHVMLMAALASTAIGVTSIMLDVKGIGNILPAQDLSAFRSCWSIKQGLKNATDFTFAWCILFAGCTILVTRSFSRILGWLAILTGSLLIPVCCFPIQTLQVHSGLRQVYAILLIIMYLTVSIWLGIALLRNKQHIPQPM